MQHFLPLLLEPMAALAQATPSPDTAERLIADFKAGGASSKASAALWLVLSQLAAIIGYWIASKVVASERGTLGKAVKVWIFYILCIFGCGAVAAVGIAFTGGLHSLPLVVVVVVVFLFLLLLIAFQVPMKVYDIGFLAALGFLLLATVISGIGQMAAGLLLGTQTTYLRRYTALPKEEQQKVLLLLQSSAGVPSQASAKLPGEDVAADRTKSLAERQAGLKMMYAELEKRRQSLPPGDEAAVAAFNAQNARYTALLQQLRTDVNVAPNGS